jgi:hypothetical protein
MERGAKKTINCDNSLFPQCGEKDRERGEGDIGDATK